VWADIAKKPNFIKVDAGMFCNNTCYLIANLPDIFIEVLNSKLVEWYLPKITTDLGEKGFRYFKQFVELIRVPKTIEDNPNKSNEVNSLYNLTPEEIEYITKNV
jgi:hypothetical protein